MPTVCEFVQSRFKRESTTFLTMIMVRKHRENNNINYLLVEWCHCSQYELRIQTTTLECECGSLYDEFKEMRRESPLTIYPQKQEFCTVLFIGKTTLLLYYATFRELLTNGSLFRKSSASLLPF